jgi:uncharacterized protein YjaZ
MEHVVAPHWPQVGAGGELERFASRRAMMAITDVEALAKVVPELRRSRISEVIREAYDCACAILPGPSTTVWLLAGDPADVFLTRFMGGVMGTIAGSGKTWLQVVPSDGWMQKIPAAVAHEHHHSVWLHRHFAHDSSFYLLNYLVFEGRACAFA